MMSSQMLSEELLQYFTRLPEGDQQEVLAFVKTYVDGEDDSEPQTLEEYNEELEKADAEIEAGNYVPHEEVVQYFLNRRQQYGN